MSFSWQIDHAYEPELRRLAELLALELRPGDCITLHGDLGAGKTTLVRALISALLNDPEVEVPSPTFGLVQSYETVRFPVAHFDFYRLAVAEEARELGFEEAAGNGVVVVEWPERAAELLPADRLDVRLTERSDPSARGIVLEGHGHWEGRAGPLATTVSLLRTAGGGGGRVPFLQGEAPTQRHV